MTPAERRRTKGDGGLTQRHDHSTCPPAIDGVRPEHRCRGRWQGTIDADIDGKAVRKYVYGRTQKIANDKLRAAVRAKEEGTLVIGSPTLERWLLYWLDNIVEVKPQTLRGYQSKVNTYLIPHLGQRRLNDLRPEHIRGLHSWLRSKGLAEASVRQTHAILKKALRDAINDGRLASSPADRVKSPKTKTNKRLALSLEQAQVVLGAAGDDARWWLGLFCGMRQGEVLGLRWEDVDLERGVLTIAQTLQTAVDGTLVFGTPKSDAGSRSFPLPPWVLARLKLHRLATVNLLERDPSSSDLVFCRPDGKPIRPRDDWQAWRDLLAAADMPPVALHAARQSAASLMEAAGVPDRLAAQILGHSTVQITHGYQSADHERIRDAWASMGRVLELNAP